MAAQRDTPAVAFTPEENDFARLEYTPLNDAQKLQMLAIFGALVACVNEFTETVAECMNRV